ncbi:serine/threonine-protein phosphatase 7 long form homolog [Rhododendron vialii]|uniref:serine/threonine-protein phosphatase 7 long form homolog n=1 Tax=Rhododendron vialii TaxID=182163 RepID=UPI00265DD91D|nr:serine/threonine-protein phosphatase 7 long form homolog [Rhododendron vialii]
MEPGPIEATVLSGQKRHRSTSVWSAGSGADSTTLTVRRREAALRRMGLPDDRIIPLVQAAGFGGLFRVPFIQLDWHLITALVERWRPETHTFHMRPGEMTITLQDVSIQLGLPIDGKPVTGSINYDWDALCRNLLGVAPPAGKRDGGRVSMKWLDEAFGVLPLDADPIAVEQHARAYILRLIGGTIFADKSSSLVHLMFLPLLEDFNTAGEYSWGSAALACLYRELCRASIADKLEVGGFMLLLQVWAWERFPHISPRRLGKFQIPDGPLITRWHDRFQVTDLPTHVLREYRYTFDRQTDDQVVWQSYPPRVVDALPPYCRAGSDIWLTSSPLICFAIIEMHQPNRVLRQFGMHQPIPSPSRSLDAPHGVDLRGGAKDWAQTHGPSIAMWDNRRDHIVQGEAYDGVMHHDDAYKEWYQRHTRQFIGRLGCSFEKMEKNLEQIYHLLGENSEACVLAHDTLALFKEQQSYFRIAPLPPPAVATPTPLEPQEVALALAPPPTPPAGTTEPPTEQSAAIEEPPPCVTIELPEPVPPNALNEVGTQGAEGVTKMGNASQPISWPSDSIVTQSWVISLMDTLDWGSRHLSPSEFPSLLPIQVFDSLVLSASKILHKEPNCVTIDGLGDNSSVVVVGDIHGQLHDLIFLLRDAGFPADNKVFVFNGDYVDRGAWGLETFLLLLAWKVSMPHKVYLLRGYHESKYYTSVYGFEKEVLTKYGDEGKHAYQKCLGCFKGLPLASIIAGRVYTTHGGLFRSVATTPSKRSKGRKIRKVIIDPGASSLALGSMEDLSKARRTVLNPSWEGLNLIPGDVLWSNPSMNPGLSLNKKRGFGLLWGPDCTEEFLKNSNLKLIIRSHEGPDARKKRPDLGGMDEGYTIDHVVESGKLITLFSAPDYPQFQATEGRYKNKGAYIVLEPPHFDSPVFHSFEAITPRPTANPYYDYKDVIDSVEELD